MPPPGRPETRRNLYFYLYPIKGSFWAWHLDQLRKHWKAFNGRKVVFVATDGGSVPFVEARARLRGLDAELYEVSNDPARGETKSFLDGLGLLESRRERELTFYAHGKGVTYSGLESLVMQSWSEAMYSMNLSAPELIERALREHDAAGCFRQEVPHAGSGWHYSGTFFWFKHSALFSRDWRDIHGDRHGVEGYLGRHIPVERSFALTPFRHYGSLYNRPVTSSECRRWLQDLRSRERAHA